MSRSPEAIIRRHIKLCASARNVIARMRHAGLENDANMIERLVEAHLGAVQHIERTRESKRPD